MPRKQVKHHPLSWQLCVRWKERAYKEKDWPDLTWFLETAMRRKLRLARKRHGPTGVDISLNRKSRKRENIELDDLAKHLTDKPTSVNQLHDRTGWHHSKLTPMLKRLAATQRAKLTDGGWIGLEAAEPPTDGQKAPESNGQRTPDNGAIPEHTKKVRVKVRGVGYVPTVIDWANRNGILSGRVGIECDQCHASQVFVSPDRTHGLCYQCGGDMPMRKADK